MIKPKYHALQIPAIDLTEAVIDTEPDRYPKRTFGITIKHLDVAIDAHNAEEARTKLLQLVKCLQKRTGTIRFGCFVLVVHDGDHAELNEGIC